MHFFKPEQPILQKKKVLLSSKQPKLVKCLRIEALEKCNLCGLYTCVDQSMLIWGVFSGIIFLSAQFLPWSWVAQAVFWSIITLIGIVAMTLLTRTWVISERVSGLLHSWSLLMILGVVITDYAIACSWGLMLIHLCDLWLILSAIGYLISGWMVRSRAFFLAAIIHGVTTLILPWFSGWQFAITGIVMMSNLLIFSEKQWDMLLPRELEQYSSLKERNFFSFSSPGFFFDHSIRLVHKFSKALLTSLAGSRLLLFSKFLLILKIKPL